MAGFFRSFTAGFGEKVEGMEGLCEDEITPTSIWTHTKSPEA